jgi:clan AA aspartic protease
MITGVVNAQLEACIRVTLRGPNGQIRRVNVVVDTGFDGWPTLPPALIAHLGLSWDRRGRAILADGSASVYDIYAGVVVWERRQHAIPIDEADTTPLVGTALLAGYQLTADFRRRGRVTIKRLGPGTQP